ncbi:MAG: Enoyl-CoA hydratase/isomerase [Candidatus Eremiobacteraeota bacterium]|nr:Enoyl-CoA hydratase/isomerase [Candidatus Eremiobacteraeota bacterium]
MLATTPYRFILAETTDDGVAVVTLNRAEKRNALSLDVMRELIAVFGAIGADRTIKVAILRGVGPAFSAGHDLREMLERSAEEYRAVFDMCVRLMETIQSIPQPVIAEIAGIATAAGCQLVATCDLAVASSAAKFATPGVKIGLFCTTPMVALTRAIGRKRAMEMLLTGEMIDAQTAADWGLVNRVVAPDELETATRALAAQIASAAGYVVGLGKAAFYAQIDLAQPQAYAYAKEVMTTNALAEDAQEGMGAFVSKRSPAWRT